MIKKPFYPKEGSNHIILAMLVLYRNPKHGKNHIMMIFVFLFPKNENGFEKMYRHFQGHSSLLVK